MPGDDLALLSEAARAAGDIALKFFEGSNRVWDKGVDDPVSEADVAVDRYLREKLRAARPDYGWLSEETEDDPARLSAERVFVVDPIDGTRAFVAGERTWAHSLAVVEAGRPVVGVVYLPARDRLYAATAGGGAALNGEGLAASSLSSADGARVLASRPTLASELWPGGRPEIERHFRPSLAYRLSLVGEGRFDGMLTLRDSWEWDIAAGALIAAESGATVTDRRGRPLVFNSPEGMTEGVVAAAPGVHADLLAGLREPAP